MSIKLAIKIPAWILGGREDWWSDFITNVEKIGLVKCQYKLCQIKYFNIWTFLPLNYYHYIF